MKGNITEKIIKHLLKNPPKSEADILAVKRDFCRKMGVKSIPTNAELLKVLKHVEMPRGVSTGAKHEGLQKLLRKRQIRTLSGVAPIAVLTKPYQCKGKCAYCPNEKAMPKSYLSNEPAVMRAVLCGFDPYKQVAMRLQALTNNGHPVDKLELIVMGGTWSYLPEQYQLWYIANCFKACNDFGHTKTRKHENTKTQSEVKNSDLIHEQKKNEKAKCRIIGLTLETRPDCVMEDELWRMREFGCTRIEIGVQHVDNKILKLNKRGHDVETTIRATKLMREFGFKITYHIMLNLPGSTPGKDFKMCQNIFSIPRFQPDQIKLYPCVVTKGSLLYQWWKQGKYKAYSTKTLVNLLIRIKSIVPEWVRIIRVIRDIPEESIMAGNKITNLRQTVQDKIGGNCKCIRCREAGHQKQNAINLPTGKAGSKQRTKKIQILKFRIKKYSAGSGAEYFLSFESRDEKILCAFCRLRIPNKSAICNLQSLPRRQAGQISDYPMIRELHTYGQMAPISGKGETQHKGLGKQLMAEAEKIVKQQGFDRLYVISGVGVRGYYRKLGYRLYRTYMIKYL